MAKSKEEKERPEKVETKQKKMKSGKKKHKSTSKETHPSTPASFSLLASDQAVNPTLLSLFAAKPTPPTPAPTPARVPVTLEDSEPEVSVEASNSEDEIQDGDDAAENGLPESPEKSQLRPRATDAGGKRKRKHRADEEDEIEDAYMRRLAREEAKEAQTAADERASKRQKPDTDEEEIEQEVEGEDASDEEPGSKATEESSDENGGDAMSPPPRHETEQTPDIEVSKANRTVFLGNVSTAAITTKASRTTLNDHLKSIFDKIKDPKDDEPKHKLESIRFRSTPYASAIPKKASFAKKEVMDETTKCTNAYAIYSSPLLAREAVKHLNGSIVLNRHLRVDSIAHPAPVDHKRCIFVGNLGFVDDESNIQAANAEDGREVRKPGKFSADVEEGLWRTFGKCGKVESVRVIRDSITRVGKGIAYVQFEDGNAVEAALEYEGKKFPPMLPRKLRVTRAKAQKRNARPGSGRPMAREKTNGRAPGQKKAGQMFGRAAASQARRPMPGRSSDHHASNGIKAPESFVFEGHRASSKGGKAGLKLGARGKKKAGKPTNRSAKRGAAYKAGAKAK